MELKKLSRINLKRKSLDELAKTMEVVSVEEQKISIGGSWSGLFGYSGCAYDDQVCQCIIDAILAGSCGSTFCPGACYPGDSNAASGVFEADVDIRGRNVHVIIDIGCRYSHQSVYTKAAFSGSGPYGKGINGESTEKYVFNSPGCDFPMWILVPASDSVYVENYFFCN